MAKARESRPPLALILDHGGGPIAAAGGFGVPLAFLVLELDLLGFAGDTLLGGGGDRGLQRGGMGRERLREHASDLVGPAAIVFDDLIGDFGHGAPRGFEGCLRPQRMPMRSVCTDPKSRPAARLFRSRARASIDRCNP